MRLNKLHHRKASVNKVILFLIVRDRSCFDSFPCMACLVRMRNAFVTLTETTMTYSVHEHVFESPELWDVNRRNNYSSLIMFCLHLMT